LSSKTLSRSWPLVLVCLGQDETKKIRQLITPAEESRLYRLIIGEHGTGKKGLIKLAVNGMDEPKGVIYVDIPRDCSEDVTVANMMRKTLGWSPDPLIDSSNPASLEEGL
jgi:hypothetical protein